MPESQVRRSSKALPPRDKATRRANRADQHAQYAKCMEGPDPKTVLSCGMARSSKQGCRSFLVLVTDIAGAPLASTDATTAPGVPSCAVEAPAVPSSATDLEQADLSQHVAACGCIETAIFCCVPRAFWPFA